MMEFQTQGVQESWILLKEEERGVEFKGMYYKPYYITITVLLQICILKIPEY